MADFVKIIRIKERMCQKSGCDNCFLSMANNGYRIECFEIIKRHPEEAQEMILKWDAEHPVITNLDKFEEVFGFRHNYRCPHIHDEICHKYSSCSGCPRYGFWNEEYVEPKEKAND